MKFDSVAVVPEAAQPDDRASGFARANLLALVGPAR
jgi:hypothetical protein